MTNYDENVERIRKRELPGLSDKLQVADLEKSGKELCTDCSRPEKYQGKCWSVCELHEHEWIRATLLAAHDEVRRERDDAITEAENSEVIVDLRGQRDDLQAKVEALTAEVEGAKLDYEIERGNVEQLQAKVEKVKRERDEWKQATDDEFQKRIDQGSECRNEKNRIRTELQAKVGALTAEIAGYKTKEDKRERYLETIRRDLSKANNKVERWEAFHQIYVEKQSFPIEHPQWIEACEAIAALTAELKRIIGKRDNAEKFLAEEMQKNDDLCNEVDKTERREVSALMQKARAEKEVERLKSLEAVYGDEVSMNAALRKEVERVTQWNDDVLSGMYVNCIYCGYRYGPVEDTPVSMADILKKHISVCPKHPMSSLRKENEALQERVSRAEQDREAFRVLVDRLHKTMDGWQHLSLEKDRTERDLRENISKLRGSSGRVESMQIDVDEIVRLRKENKNLIEAGGEKIRELLLENLGLRALIDKAGKVLIKITYRPAAFLDAARDYEQRYVCVWCGSYREDDHSGPCQVASVIAEINEEKM